MPKFLNYFDTLAQTDIRRMKKDLVEWAERNPNAILLFDYPIIHSIFMRMTDQNVSGCRTSEGNMDSLLIENIEIEWDTLGGRKSILKRIAEKDTGRIIYKQPVSWEESEIWYQFKY